jgi:dynein heavy chain, axonemal
MSDTMSLLFEVQDLAVASPATVSRAGMVYIDVADLGWGPYVASWVARVHASSPIDRDLTNALFTKYVARLLKFKRKECKELVPVSDFAAVIALCNLLQAIHSPENGLGAAAAAESASGAGPGGYDKVSSGCVKPAAAAALCSHTLPAFALPPPTSQLFERWFAFACVWSIGAAVDEAGRRRFNDCVREIEPLFPPTGLVYDYAMDAASRDFKPWADRLSASWRPPKDAPFARIIVPTVDTVRNLYIMQTLMAKGTHVLLVGNTGTGKTVLSSQQLDALQPDEFTRLTINFSAATSSNTVQDIIEGSLEKRSKNKMGPPSGKRMVVFVDDLNMPKKDRFGSQPPLELLRQWIDYGGWYDRGKQTWRFILDMQLLAAMGPPGGGRSVISERLQSRFNVVNFTFPAEKQVCTSNIALVARRPHFMKCGSRHTPHAQVRGIFEAILAPKLADFSDEVKKLVPGLVAATVAVYERTIESFLPTPANAHYLFNMRDIARVIQVRERHECAWACSAALLTFLCARPPLLCRA